MNGLQREEKSLTWWMRSLLQRRRVAPCSRPITSACMLCLLSVLEPWNYNLLFVLSDNSELISVVFKVVFAHTFVYGKVCCATQDNPFWIFENWKMLNQFQFDYQSIMATRESKQQYLDLRRRLSDLNYTETFNAEWEFSLIICGFGLSSNPPHFKFYAAHPSWCHTCCLI